MDLIRFYIKDRFNLDRPIFNYKKKCRSGCEVFKM